MTESEKLNIINQVLSSIRTNSKTLNELTPVTLLNDTDYFEVSGGRRVSFATLAALVSSLSEGQQGTLQQAIERCVLQSASVSVTDTTATLTINSVGKTITTSIPVATDSKVGLITPLEKARIATTYDIATVARETANTAKTKAESALSTASAIADSKGARGGLAPLDSEGKVPAAHLPDSVGNALINFADFVGQTQGGLSGPGGGIVVRDATALPGEGGTIDIVYNARTNRLIARLTTRIESEGEIAEEVTYYRNWSDGERYGTLGDGGRIPYDNKIYYCEADSTQYRCIGGVFQRMASPLEIGETEGTAYDGAKGKATAEKVEALEEALGTAVQSIEDSKGAPEGLAPLDENAKVPMLNLPGDLGNAVRVFSGFVEVDSVNDTKYSMTPDVCGVFFNSNTNRFIFGHGPYANDCEGGDSYGEATPQGKKPFVSKLYIDSSTGKSYYYHGDSLVLCSSGKPSTVVVTVERINSQEPNNPGTTNETYYDTLESAIEFVIAKSMDSLGMTIKFATGPETWKSYQYIGQTTDPDDLRIEDYWIDDSSMKSGEEPFIIVNLLCNHPGPYASLAYALADIAALEERTGIKYRKESLHISYKVGDQQWEDKKFVGNVNDFLRTELWRDFGGGGSAVTIETKDEPEEDGTDAFSTGGAASFIPVSHMVQREGNETTITFLNTKGEPIFDPIVVISTGGGEGGGTAIGITAEQATVYAAYGMPMVAKFAIRSETITAANVTPNAIEKVEIIDRDTNQVVYSWNGSKESASSLDREEGDWNFEIDLKDIFSTASEKRLNIIATDEMGKTASRAFRAVAEDVTISCRQPLDFASGNRIPAGAEETTIDCYQFEKTTSAVRAYVDILKGGEWVNIHEKVLADNNKNYSKSITFSPAALGLSHGAYQIRMYGVSENSHVRGNTIYSTLFVIDPNEDGSMIGIRYDDRNNGQVMNFESVNLEVAAYKPGNVTGLDVTVSLNNQTVTVVKCLSNSVRLVTVPVNNVEEGTILRFKGCLGSRFSPEVEVEVHGSAVDVQLKSNALFHFDFASRSNSEPDHTISSNGYTMQVSGCNWITSGFISYLGETAFRVAENMIVQIPWAPYGDPAIESTGVAYQLRFATDNIADANAMLMECFDPTCGASFYIKGNEIGIYVLNGTRQLETRRFQCGKINTLLCVAEPSSIYEERGGVRYGRYYMYFNGEKIGRVGYLPGKTPSDLLNSRQITIDGRYGDFYLYSFIAWRSYLDWSEAMSNYLAKLVDVQHLKREYEFENVLRAQNAEDVQMMRPQIDALLERGIAVRVYVGSKEDFDRFDSGTDTSENFYFDIYHFDPIPWRSYIAYHVRVRRQGTTSAKRPKKNTRDYFSQCTCILPMYPDYADDHVLTAEQLADLRITYDLFAIKMVRIGAQTIPVSVATCKVDFSDSTGANDCGTCNMANAAIRSMAKSDPMFLTPAQRAYDGTFDKGDIHLSGLEMNHSTANEMCALFRSVDNMQNAYFEAKANYKEDKGEQVALGFIDTPGYNKGCKNWQSGDFRAIYGNPGETLDQLEARFKAMNDLDTDQLYLLQPYCSRNYRFMRYRNGAWSMSPGSMRQVGGRWVITGDVLNPVNGWEMLNYTGMNWCQGVGSVDDLMRGSTEYSSWVQKLITKGKIADGANVPAWTYYFECMVDNDDLALAYAQGKVVPFELYQFLRFTDRADYASKEDWATIWHDSAWKYLSVRSNYFTRGMEDYNSMRDSVSKNKQPMAFLEDGHCVVNGVYDPEASGAEDTDGFNHEFGITAAQSPMIIYFNKIYDIDGANDKDNDGGGTGDPEEDPDKMSDPETGYTNTYAGHGSVLFRSCAMQDTAIIDAVGNEMSYRSTIAAMRSCQTTLEDGTIIKPFSPEGAIHYYCEERTQRWPKNVSSYDGYRKYEQYTATSDAIYFYAEQGLGLDSIPQYIRTRWRYRDGYYQTGDFFAQDGTISGRIEAPENAKIRIKAAKTGYFGIGNDASGSVSERVFLQAGEEHEFTNFRKNNGALIYIYQADRMEEIDLSELTLSEGFNFNNMKLAKKILLGSDTHQTLSMAFTPLTQPIFGNLPFLETIDIRNTEIVTVAAEGCPRLRHFHADGSALTTLTLAQTSPINDVTLPSTMIQLRFSGMPELTYNRTGAGEGLVIPSMPVVSTIVLEASPHLDGCSILKDTLASQVGNLALRNVRIAEIRLHGTGEELAELVSRTYEHNGQIKHVGGIDELGLTDKPVIVGTYELEKILEQSDIDAIEDGIIGITVEVVLAAYIDRIDEVNAEYYTGMAEVEEVTEDNIGEHLRYYNGETYEEYMARQAEGDRSIHDIIND